MEQIGDGSRKPRRTRGTPSYQYRNRFAWATLAAGTLFFGISLLLPNIRELHLRLAQQLGTPTVEELERHELFQRPAARTSNFIQDIIDTEKQFNTDK